MRVQIRFSAMIKNSEILLIQARQHDRILQAAAPVFPEDPSGCLHMSTLISGEDMIKMDVGQHVTNIICLPSSSLGKRGIAGALHDLRLIVFCSAMSYNKKMSHKSLLTRYLCLADFIVSDFFSGCIISQ